MKIRSLLILAITVICVCTSAFAGKGRGGRRSNRGAFHESLRKRANGKHVDPRIESAQKSFLEKISRPSRTITVKELSKIIEGSKEFEKKENQKALDRIFEYLVTERGNATPRMQEEFGLLMGEYFEILSKGRKNETFLVTPKSLSELIHPKSRWSPEEIKNFTEVLKETVSIMNNEPGRSLDAAFKKALEQKGIQEEDFISKCTK